MKAREKRGASVGVRLTPTNESRLSQLQSLGISIGTVVNDLLDEHWNSYVKAKAQKLQKVITDS